jgi:hypothetical protein
MLCCLVACTSKGEVSTPPTQALHTTQWKESATVQVSRDGPDIPEGEDPASFLQDRGAVRGVREVFNVWLTRGLLFEQKEGIVSVPRSGDFLILDQDPGVEYDASADVYSGWYAVQVRFAPRAGLEGEIIDLRGERSMAAGFDDVLIRGGQWLSGAENAFFLVARPAAGVEAPVMRMIGTGRITQVLGTLAQGRLLETNREIRVGDAVCPVRVSIRRERDQRPASRDGRKREIEEVIVEPEPLPSSPQWSAPAEPK